MSNRDIVAAHYAAGERGDVPAMIANFRDDIRWVEAAGFPLAGLYIGKTTVVDHVFQVLNAEWQGFGMHPEEIIEEGDRVIVIGRYIATHRGTGRALNARTIHLWNFDAGRIASFEQLTDTLLVAEARRPVATMNTGV